MKQRAMVEIEWRGIEGGELKTAGELKVAQTFRRAIKGALQDRFASNDEQALVQVIVWAGAESIRVHEAWRNTDPVVDQVRQTLQNLKGLAAACVTVI